MTLKKTFPLFFTAGMTLFGLLVIVLLNTALNYSPGALFSQTSIRIPNAQVTVNGETRDMTLPAYLTGLERGSTVEVSFSVDADPDSVLYFSSVHSPVEVYDESGKLYEYGMEGTYPSIFRDPPTNVVSVRLRPLPSAPNRSGGRICMVYHVPQMSKTLTIHDIRTGSLVGVFKSLIRHQAIPMMFSLVFIITGLGLILITPMVFRDVDRCKVLLYPGLSMLSVGCWQFAENEFTIYLFQKPSLFYVMSYAGLYFLVIPLFLAVDTLTGMNSQRFPRIAASYYTVSLLGITILQVAGIVPFHRVVTYFHISLLCGITMMSVVLIRHSLKKGSAQLWLFTAAYLALTFSAYVEGLNYYLHFSERNTVFFQIGYILFSLLLGVLAGQYYNSVNELQFRNMMLQNEVRLQNRTIDVQRVRTDLLLSHTEEVRKQRHDLRHHLRTMSAMLEDKRYPDLRAYLDSVSDAVPLESVQPYCDNTAVSSILSYYSALAKDAGIDIRIQAQIPSVLEHVADSTVCIIVGNLLENAIEACSRISVPAAATSETAGKTGPEPADNPNAVEPRFIRFHSLVQGNMLVITADNSCLTAPQPMGQGLYRSSKREGPGTGILSIRSLAEKHGGSAEFETDHHLFRASVYIEI